jgi:hypothetical protein
MAHKDIISKNILKRILLDIAVYLFKLDLVDAELLSTEEQRIEDRRSDLLAKVTAAHGESFILHLEIQNNNDRDMPVRMLRYLTDIKLAHPGYAVHQCLVYIGAAPIKMRNSLDSPQLSYHYDLVDMRDIDYHMLYDSDSPDALVLTILCDFRGHDPDEMVVHILQKLHAMTRHDEKRQREYLQMLEILADNRHLNVNIQEAYDMLHIEIERLPSYQKGMKKGIEEGVERGMEIGEHKRSLEIARKLLAMNFGPEQIIAITRLSLTEIQQLATTEE